MVVTTRIQGLLSDSAWGLENIPTVIPEQVLKVRVMS